MPRIFISYRHNDTKTMSGRIKDRLENSFKKRSVFLDEDSIQAGDNFPEEIDTAIQACDVFLVVMGRRWVSRAGLMRLQDPNDWVRIEIKRAIELDKFVIPILINLTEEKMPSQKKLPDELRLLSLKKAAIVRDNPDFNTDTNRLIKGIRNQFPSTKPIPTPDELKFDWQATFFNSTNFTGTGIPFGGAINDLNFNWGTGVPLINRVPVPGIGADNFSIRFTTTANIPTANYEMIVASKDGIRVFIDGQRVHDYFFGRALTTDPPIKLPKGVHNFTVEYFHGIDQATIVVKILKKAKNR